MAKRSGSMLRSGWLRVTVVFVVVSMGAVFKLIDTMIGLRVSRQEEPRGPGRGRLVMGKYLCRIWRSVSAFEPANVAGSPSDSDA